MRPVNWVRKWKWNRANRQRSGKETNFLALGLFPAEAIFNYKMEGEWVFMRKVPFNLKFCHPSIFCSLSRKSKNQTNIKKHAQQASQLAIDFPIQFARLIRMLQCQCLCQCQQTKNAFEKDKKAMQRTNIEKCEIDWNEWWMDGRRTSPDIANGSNQKWISSDIVKYFKCLRIRDWKKNDLGRRGCVRMPGIRRE